MTKKQMTALSILFMAFGLWNHQASATTSRPTSKAISRPTSKAHKVKAEKQKKNPVAQEKKSKLPKHSLYQLPAKWTDQNGKTVDFSSLRGKPRIISMIYTSCPQACPLTISDIKRIEAGIPKKDRKRLGFVLVTFDPVIDTIKVLKKLAKKRRLNLKHWTLLRGSSEQVMELAALLGVKYKKISKVDFAHSNLITILDANGVIKHQQIGLRQDPDKSIQVLKNLLGF